MTALEPVADMTVVRSEQPSVAPAEMVVLPSGEAIDLSGEEDVLAEAWDVLREYERQAKELRDMIGDEMRRRMDRRASWTAHAGRYTVSCPSTEPVTEYDAASLWVRLTALVCDGVIDPAARDAAVERETVYKPKANGIKKLKKLGGDVLAAIEACESKSDRTSRPVQVKIAKEARA